MKNILSIITLALSYFCCGHTAAQNTNTYRLNIGDFSELQVLDGINVDYRASADSAGYAVFTANRYVAPSIIFNNKGSKLAIQLAPEYIGKTDFPTITVYSRYLAKVYNHGDSTVRVLTIAPGAKFEAKLEGNGRLAVRSVDATEVNVNLRLGHGSIIIGGKCEKAKFTSVGTGVIEGDELQATDVTVKASGTGSIGVWATKNLSVYGMGSTSVYYRTYPETKLNIQKRSLGIKLIPFTQPGDRP